MDSQTLLPSEKRLLGDLSEDELNFCAEMAMSLEVEEPAAVAGNVDVESLIEARRSRGNTPTPRQSPVEHISISPIPALPQNQHNSTVRPTGPSSLNDQTFTFDTQNTFHAQATLNTITTPYPEGHIPEHVLLALGANNDLTHRLDFYQTYHPNDIVNAFHTNDYTIVNSQDATPRRTRTPFAAPLPAPISSNEVTVGSDATIVIDSSTEAAESSDETINLDTPSFSFELSQDEEEVPEDNDAVAVTSNKGGEEKEKEGHTK